MSRICQITGKRALNGYRVSHAHNRSKHVQQVNLHKKQIWVPELGRRVKVLVSCEGLRSIDKRGAYRMLKQAGLI